MNAAKSFLAVARPQSRCAGASLPALMASSTAAVACSSVRDVCNSLSWVATRSNSARGTKAVRSSAVDVFAAFAAARTSSAVAVSARPSAVASSPPRAVAAARHSSAVAFAFRPRAVASAARSIGGAGSMRASAASASAVVGSLPSLRPSFARMRFSCSCMNPPAPFGSLGLCLWASAGRSSAGLFVSAARSIAVTMPARVYRKTGLM